MGQDKLGDMTYPQLVLSCLVAITVYIFSQRFITNHLGANVFDWVRVGGLSWFYIDAGGI